MRVESLTVFHRCGDLVVRGRRNSSYRDPATEEQLLGRMRFANQINLWRRFPKGFQPMFEGRRPGVSDYNMFVSHNMQSDPVYLTRHEAENRGCVLTQIAVSDGTLPSIALSHDGVAPVTDLSVGGLVAGSATTVAELSKAIVMNNSGYCFGDELVYYLGLQQWDAMLDIPVVEMRCARLVLCTKDSRSVAAATDGAAGFAVRGGLLAAAAAVQGGMAWVHVRRRAGGLQLSGQRMVCSNPYIALFSGKEAFATACRSYGKNMQRPMLEPDGTMARCRGI